MKKTTAKVEGMRCGMCESHVNDIVRRNFNVKKVTSSHVKGETVILSGQPIDAEQLVRVISADGYGASDVRKKSTSKKVCFPFSVSNGSKKRRPRACFAAKTD